MEELNASYWSNRYKNHETAWDIGFVSTPLKNYFDQLTDLTIKILIPGCGRGYEGIYLWEIGFKNIFFLDFSEEALGYIKNRIPSLPEKQLICGDFFHLDDYFDLIIEQTMFCAIDPTLRETYLKKVESSLTPNGKMVGLLFNRDFEIGPPFGGNYQSYQKLYSKHFNIQKMEECYNSIEARRGFELFFIAKKKFKVIPE